MADSVQHATATPLASCCCWIHILYRYVECGSSPVVTWILFVGIERQRIAQPQHDRLSAVKWTYIASGHARLTADLSPPPHPHPHSPLPRGGPSARHR
jgi:hypothetical protein